MKQEPVPVVPLDVSSLPRAFYFNIAKVLFKKMKDDKAKNLFFAVSENVEVDNGIEKTTRLIILMHCVVLNPC